MPIALHIKLFNFILAMLKMLNNDSTKLHPVMARSGEGESRQSFSYG